MSTVFLLVDEMAETSEIPAIKPLKAAIRTAEMSVDLGVFHGRITYSTADF